MSSRGRGSDPVLRAAVISALAATPALSDEALCETRDWAAHEHGHRDLGHGRVAWMWSWSAEGVADDILVMDCATGQGLRARARAERMTAPLPYDRRARAARVLQRAADAPHFFRFDRLAEAFDTIHVPSEPLARDTEPCACAALYPGRFDAGQSMTRDQ
ncbi:hypothetical protein [Cognatishimia sp. F0-27]|uniref:hypothetical protein n=1 Tax=Cognatishimia sp. F0-27 TaxID=2816855 RepID=UPI001D0C14C3|nr:hypothetical protein [Cognatishimia sp. F0-27]MCC1492318.1 hypothetical protein [Cognatishimia sp. F0-27]